MSQYKAARRRVLKRLELGIYPRRGADNPGELGEHNADPAWGSIVTHNPGDYVGKHRRNE